MASHHLCHIPLASSKSQVLPGLKGRGLCKSQTHCGSPQGVLNWAGGKGEISKWDHLGDASFIQHTYTHTVIDTHLKNSQPSTYPQMFSSTPSEPLYGRNRQTPQSNDKQVPLCTGGFLSLRQIRLTIHSSHTPSLNMLWCAGRKQKQLILQIAEFLNADIMSFVLTPQKHWHFIIFKVYRKVKHAPLFNIFLRSQRKHVICKYHKSYDRNVGYTDIKQKHQITAFGIAMISALFPSFVHHSKVTLILSKEHRNVKW